MKRMTATVVVMGLLVLLMLAGVLPAPGGQQAVVFTTPVFIALTACLAVLTLYCAARGGGARRRVAFLLTHVGVVVILAGAVIGHRWGERHEVMIPVRDGHVVRTIPLPDGNSVPLPCGLSCSRFEVTYYDPTYDLYRPAAEAGGTAYVKVSSHAVQADGVRLGARLGTVARADLATAGEGGWKEQHVFTNGWVLQLSPPTPRMFAADVAFHAGDGVPAPRRLAVNKPLTFAGWRFYLMSYDREAERYVVLTARRDPGRRLVVAGIWMLLAGTALLGVPRLRAAGAGGAP